MRCMHCRLADSALCKFATIHFSILKYAIVWFSIPLDVTAKSGILYNIDYRALQLGSRGPAENAEPALWATIDYSLEYTRV